MPLRSFVTKLSQRPQIPIPSSNSPVPKPNPSKGDGTQFTKSKLTKTTETLVGQNGKTHDWCPYHNLYVVARKAQDYFLNPSHPKFKQSNVTKNQISVVSF